MPNGVRRLVSKKRSLIVRAIRGSPSPTPSSRRMTNPAAVVVTTLVVPRGGDHRRRSGPGAQWERPNRGAQAGTTPTAVERSPPGSPNGRSRDHDRCVGQSGTRWGLAAAEAAQERDPGGHRRLPLQGAGEEGEAVSRRAPSPPPTPVRNSSLAKAADDQRQDHSHHEGGRDAEPAGDDLGRADRERDFRLLGARR